MNIAVVFAGGSGVRMGSGIPKQFLEINGKPIIVYTTIKSIKFIFPFWNGIFRI